MNIKKIIVAILLSTLFLACMESKEVKSLKNATLYGYENKTLGEAVEGFFEDPTWKKPTDEQIKNLHDMLCIDVEMLGE